MCFFLQVYRMTKNFPMIQFPRIIIIILVPFKLNFEIAVAFFSYLELCSDYEHSVYIFFFFALSLHTFFLLFCMYLIWPGILSWKQWEKKNWFTFHILVIPKIALIKLKTYTVSINSRWKVTQPVLCLRLYLTFPENSLASSFTL